MGRIKDEFIKEMKAFSGSSFMTISELTEWSGRSDSYVSLLVWPLDWVQAAGRTRLYFIPDVAEAIERRLSSGEGSETSARPGLERSVNRSAYQDHIIGRRAREHGVAPKYSDLTKRTAVALADEIGTDAAARTLEVNVNTLNSWRYARDVKAGNAPKSSKSRKEKSATTGKHAASKGRRKDKGVLDEDYIYLPFICV